MKNIELIDRAIDALKGEACNAADGYNHQYNFLWLDEVRGYRFTAGGQHYVGEYICKRAEFLARKAERQNKPDWRNSSDWAHWLAQDSFGKWWWYPNFMSAPTLASQCFINGSIDPVIFAGAGEVIGDWRDTLERRPDHIGETNEKAVTESDWPDENRIDVIGTNGNTGESYKANQPKTAADYLAACAQVQSERGKQYDASGTGERSFDAAAEAFNCITGKNLRGSDVCLILEMVKLVRQYSGPTRLHADSVLDKVSYSALWAEQITAELGK